MIIFHKILNNMDQTQLKEWVAGIAPDAVFQENKQFVTVVVNAGELLGLMKKLKEDKESSFDYLFCISGADQDNKLWVIYHLQSTAHGHEMVVKTFTEDRENAKLDSVYSLYKGAELHEDEIFDLFGINFNGHPNMRRMFMPDDWKGYPLRKDYVDEVNIIDLT